MDLYNYWLMEKTAESRMKETSIAKPILFSPKKEELIADEFMDDLILSDLVKLPVYPKRKDRIDFLKRSINKANEERPISIRETAAGGAILGGAGFGVLGTLSGLATKGLFKQKPLMRGLAGGLRGFTSGAVSGGLTGAMGGAALGSLWNPSVKKRKLLAEKVDNMSDDDFRRLEDVFTRRARDLREEYADLLDEDDDLLID